MITRMFLIILLLSMFAGQQLYLTHQELGTPTNFNLTQTTDSAFKANASFSEKNSYPARISSALDTFIAGIFELTKGAFEFGYSNPQHDFRTIMWSLLFVILMPSLFYLIAVSYVLGVWVKDKFKR